MAITIKNLINALNNGQLYKIKKINSSKRNVF